MDQYQLQALWVLVHFTDLLSIVFRRNGFARIQKAVANETGNRRPTVTKIFVCVCVWVCVSLVLESALQLLSPTTDMVATGCCVK